MNFDSDAERGVIIHAGHLQGTFRGAKNSMSQIDLNARITELKGQTLRTLKQAKLFDVSDVTDTWIRVIPRSGNGTERPIRRDRVEHIARLNLGHERLLQTIREEYPTTQNSSYIAAIAWHVMS